MKQIKNVKLVSTPRTAKLPYEPPQANFVPLQVEERLLACDKSSPACLPNTNS